MRQTLKSSFGPGTSRVVTQVVGGRRGVGEMGEQHVTSYRTNNKEEEKEVEGEEPREGGTSLIFGSRSHQEMFCWTRVQGLLREPLKGPLQT